MVGLRPYDHQKLRELAKSKGCREQDLAGMILEDGIRKAGAPPDDVPTDCYGERLAARA